MAAPSRRTLRKSGPKNGVGDRTLSSIAAQASIKSAVAKAKRAGKTAATAGNHLQASRLFTQALTLSESAMPNDTLNSTSLLLWRSASYAKLGEWRRSILDAESVLRVMPDSTTAFARKGEGLLHQRQFKQAAESFNAGLRLNPEDAVLKSGVHRAIQGLRSQRHHFSPAAPVPSADSLPVLPFRPPSPVVPGRAFIATAVTPTPASVTLPSTTDSAMQLPVPHLAVLDTSIHRALLEVGALVDVEDLLGAEASAMSELERDLDVDLAREQVMELLAEYRSMLHRLFLQFCASQSRMRDELRGTAPWVPKAGEPSVAFASISDTRSITESQFWEFVVSSGLVTRRFNRAAVQKAWAVALRPVALGSSSSSSSSSGVGGGGGRGPGMVTLAGGGVLAVPESPAPPTSAFASPMPPPRVGSYGGHPSPSPLTATRTTAATRPPASTPSRPRAPPKLSPSPGLHRRVAGVAPSPLRVGRTPRPVWARKAVPAGQHASSSSSSSFPATTLSFNSPVPPTTAPHPPKSPIHPSPVGGAGSAPPAQSATADAALFPKFVEALVRLCLARYKPIDLATAQARAKQVAVAMRQAAATASATASAGGGFAAMDDPASPPVGLDDSPTRVWTLTSKELAELDVPSMPQRLQFAFDTHVVPLYNSIDLPRGTDRQQLLRGAIDGAGFGGGGGLAPRGVGGGGEVELEAAKPRKGGVVDAGMDTWDAYWDNFVPSCGGGAGCPCDATVSAALASAAAGSSVVSSSLTGQAMTSASAKSGQSTAPTTATTAQKEWAAAGTVVRRMHTRLEKLFRFFGHTDRLVTAMDIREFLYMFKSLQLTDGDKLDLNGVARVVTATVGFGGDCKRQMLQFDDFCEAVARAVDMQTNDGMVRLPDRLESFLVTELFPKAAARCFIPDLE